MLKWALHPTTPSSSSTAAIQQQQQQSYIPPTRRRHSTAINMTSSRESVGHAIETIFRRKSLSNTARRKSRHEELNNKENLGSTQLVRSPYANISITPFQDLSNGQSPNRTPTARTPQQRRRFDSPFVAVLQHQRIECSTTLPTFDVEYSPYKPEDDVAEARIPDKFLDKPLNPRLFKLRQNSIVDESLSSSKIGDTTLDKMLDAIIESAKKDQRPVDGHLPRTKSIESDFEDTSIHEMEVITPPHLKRQKGVRRKHKIEPPSSKEQRPQKLIGLTLPNGIPSPETPDDNYYECGNFESLANMKTPPAVTILPQICSTPTKEQSDLIKRCLSFSPDSDEEFVCCKRGSVASSTASSGRYVLISGSLDLAIFFEDGELNLHVIRCRDLLRPNGSTSINAYVKVAILPADTDNHNGYQRTAVHRNSSRPYFDHRFKFCIHDEELQFAGKRLQLAVWHRDRELKRSEFLGCMSFPVINILKSNINGSYKLQSQSCLTNPIPAVQLTSTVPPTPSKQTSSINNFNHNNNHYHHHHHHHHHQQTVNNTEIINRMAGSVTDLKNEARQTSIDDDESISMDGGTSGGNLIDSNTGQPIAFSKKAIHQRDADENLFLRFLELDPPPDSTPPPSTTGGGGGGAATSAVSSNNSNSTAAGPVGGAALRRMSTLGKPSLGRTPFTVTKRLTRTADKGFGFSIVWTHPPRIEKIEPGLSAAQNLIHPGDYVIFVDKHNVVTMPEADVLNLIRSQGNTLTLEIFRRSPSSGVPALNTAPRPIGLSSSVLNSSAATSAIVMPFLTQPAMSNGLSKSRVASVASTTDERSISPALKHPVTLNLSGMGGPRSSTACSNASIETTKRKLLLPQVTFSKEIERRRMLLLNQQRPNNGINSIQSIGPITDHRRRFLLQLISREQNFVAALQFGMERFVTALVDRKDLISPNDHRTLFQNIDELMRISEDILEQLVQQEQEQEPQMNFLSRVYLSKTTAICAAYKKYCNGIKRADCVLVNKSRQPGSDFVTFITEPQIPRRRPDLTMLIHRPLQHFREILKLMQLLASHCHVDTEEHKNFTSVINELQSAYREITVGGGLMEPLGEGRPLLTLQDLEARMVFTRCKPFTLAVQGRQWIFGGDLSRVEGRSIKPYWTLLFSDIIVFAKVSRDRVLFITEEPLPIVNIVDSCFNIRKKNTEFRITVDPNGRMAESPTAYCAPDLSRTPRKNTRRKSLVLRAPSLELKAVWQNLLQRQIFLVNAVLGSTPLSSPLDSPDVLNTLVPLSDIGAANTSMASMKLASMDSLNLKNQQQHQHRNINPIQHMESLIDEKCRILNKTGTPKGSALHLANWMKGQLDKQQEQARLAAVAHDSVNAPLDKDEQFLTHTEDDEERITFWTREQLEKRTKELNLAKESAGIRPIHAAFGGKRLSGCEEVGFLSDVESEIKSLSRSTTSDSQITVRSSPNAILLTDKLSVCRHCHKNCKQLNNNKSNSASPSPSPPLLNNSLKVQHSQSSPNRCCPLNGILTAALTQNQDSNNSCSTARDSSVSSASSTITGDNSLTDELPSLIVKKEVPIKPIRLPRPTSVCSVPITTGAQLNGQLSDDQFKNTTINNNNNNNNTYKSTVRASSTTSATVVTSCQKFQKNTDNKNFIACHCKCTPADFTNTTISPDELTQETCKLIDDVSQLPKTPISHQSSPASQKITKTPKHSTDEHKNLHKNCKCICKKFNHDHNNDDQIGDDDLSLVLIGLAQLNPTVKLLNADAFVPTISVVPPTPDAILSKTSINIWDNQNSITTTTRNLATGHATIENIPDSPDDSPIDEDLPYRPMSTTLKRYGTLSDLEKMQSETDENGDNRHGSSDEDGDMEIDDRDDDEDNEIDDDDDDDDDDDIKVITREVFDENQQTSLRNWTARAGSYVAGKISFLEDSRAFIDKYLGRWNQEQENDEEQMEECTSGATSGEEVWGTPTSCGETDDLQMPNSDLTQSSPTRSSGSFNDDDDTELMMDELLMAPPMTASTIRGLLPRRRLEPLFEEETESDEEKTQQESEDIKKGETAANGHDLEDSIGSSSDEPDDNVPQTHRPQQIAKQQQQQQQRRPNRYPATMEDKQTPIALQLQIKQMQLQKRNMLMMRNSGAIVQTTSIPIRETAITTITDSSPANPSVTTTLSNAQTTTTTTTTTVDAKTNQMLIRTTGSMVQTLTRVLKTSAITTINCNENSITCIGAATMPPPPPPPSTIIQKSVQMTKTKFSPPPPPPPPRRLLLTQSNLMNQHPLRTGSPQQNQSQSHRIPKSGNIADIGSLVDALKMSTTVETTISQDTQARQKAASNTKDYAASTGRVVSKPDQLITRKCDQQINETQPNSNSLRIQSTSDQDRPITMKIPDSSLIHTTPRKSETESQSVHGSGLSPRLEMRLALNHDILGDEDLICYDPGPDLTTILGHDLSTFHRLTGRDLLNRSATNRIQPKEAVISFCQQRNSKMDTPTVNRKRQQLVQPNQPNRNTWNSSAYADPIVRNDTKDDKHRKGSNSSDGSKLSDLELLARREKMYCMSQSRSGSPAMMTKNKSTAALPQPTTTTKTTTTMTTMMTTVMSSQTTTMTTSVMRQSTSSMFGVKTNHANDDENISQIGSGDISTDRDGEKGNRLYNFLLRRNSENQLTKIFSQSSLVESTASSTPDRRRLSTSPRKDIDKPSLNRRFWKQLTKRRRANSVTEIFEIAPS